MSGRIQEGCRKAVILSHRDPRKDARQPTRFCPPLSCFVTSGEKKTGKYIFFPFHIWLTWPIHFQTPQLQQCFKVWNPSVHSVSSTPWEGKRTSPLRHVGSPCLFLWARDWSKKKQKTNPFLLGQAVSRDDGQACAWGGQIWPQLGLKHCVTLGKSFHPPLASVSSSFREGRVWCWQRLRLALMCSIWFPPHSTIPFFGWRGKLFK